MPAQAYAASQTGWVVNSPDLMPEPCAAPDGADHGRTDYWGLSFGVDDNTTSGTLSPTVYTGNQARTLLFWVYYTGGAPGLVNLNYGPTLGGFGVRIWNTTSVRLYLNLSGNYVYWTLGSALSTSAWHLFVVTYDGLGNGIGNFRLSIDGSALVQATGYSGTIPNPLPTINRINCGGYAAFKLTQIAGYPVAWSDAQITAYRTGGYSDIRQYAAGLDFYYRMQPGSGQTLLDESSRGRNMQLGTTSGEDTNDPAWTPAGAAWTWLTTGGPAL